MIHIYIASPFLNDTETVVLGKAEEILKNAEAVKNWILERAEKYGTIIGE